MASEGTYLRAQLLQWLAERPRCYAEVRAAWSSTCPLNCIWEDAVAEDLVRRGPDGRFCLTARGQTQLAQGEGAARDSVALIAGAGAVS